MDCFIGIVIVGGVAVGATIFYFKRFVIPKLNKKTSTGASMGDGEGVKIEDPGTEVDE